MNVTAMSGAQARCCANQRRGLRAAHAPRGATRRCSSSQTVAIRHELPSQSSGSHQRMPRSAVILDGDEHHQQPEQAPEREERAVDRGGHAAIVRGWPFAPSEMW